MDPSQYISGYGDLDAALAQNAALGQQQAQKPKKGFGSFLRAFAGIYGDTLTGNPVYAQQQAQRAEQQQMEQWYERKRKDEMADYEAKKRIDAQYSAPDKPGLADEFDWFKQQSPETQKAVQDYMKMRYPGQFTPPTPITMEPGDTLEGSSDVTAVNPQTGETIRYNPKTGKWEAAGGPSQNGSGGFP